MALPETTLSNPLLNASYNQFLEVYRGTRPPSKTEIDKAAISLYNQPGAPDHTLIHPHRAQLTPDLAQLGASHISPRLAQEYLEGIKQGLLGQEGSIRESFRELSSSTQSPLPSLPISTIRQQTHYTSRSSSPSTGSTWLTK